MTRIVFLDCDGVLNSADRARYLKWPWAICPQMMARLNRLCLIAHADIVVSSAWRIGRTVEQLEALFRSHGLDASVRVIGVTPRLDRLDGACYVSASRGEEIRAWLRERDLPRCEFVVLDDDDDMDAVRDRFVKTTWQRGLQDHHVIDALRILGVSES